MTSSLVTRFAARAATLAKSRAPSSAAAVHTYIRQEETLVDPAVYEKEEHKFDFDGRDSRFPKTVAVPEGGPRVSFPDYPSIMRHSLSEPGYGSFGHSLRDPAYEFVPKRHLSSDRAPPARRRRSRPQPAEDDGVSEFAQCAPVWRLL